MKAFLIASIFVLVFCSFGAFAEPPAENANWNFEIVSQGQAAGWKQNPEYPYDRIEITGDAHQGSNSAVTLLFENANPEAQAHYYCESELKPEQENLTVGLWAKGSGRLSLLAYVYSVEDGQEKFQSSVSFRLEESPGTGSVEVATEWTEHFFTLPAGDLPQQPFSLRLVLAARGSVSVDDIAVTGER